MKKVTVYILLIVLCSLRVNAQELFQQTKIELNDLLDENQSYLCQATSSIELLPGFVYIPAASNEMQLDVDRYSVYPPSDGLYGGNGDDECVVGTMPGVLDVSATGAATYSIDVKLPQALGTMTPKLAIAYNSQSANGLLGWSWDLQGVSSIERVGQTEYHDGKATNVDFENDRYVVDGQRLMSVGANEYKTEIDNLDKIVSYEGSKKGPDYFVVWKSDGTIWEYGTTADSKVEPQGNDEVVLKWLLCKVVDRNGNAIRYNYYENNATGESYIKSIEYTSNDKANVKPAYRVAFVYDERIDAAKSYVGGSVVSKSKILKSIEVISNASGKKMIEYQLLYDEPGHYNNNYYIHYRLNSIQLTVSGKKLNPTRIIWNSERKFATDNSSGYKKYELDKTIFNRVSFVGDFNGDGFSDVLLVPYKIQDTYPSDVEGEIYLNNCAGSFSEKPFAKISLSKYLDWIYVCDINGDGVDDIIPYEIQYDAIGVFEVVRFNVFITSAGGFLNKNTYEYERFVTLMPGNYIDRNNCCILVVDAYDGKKNKDLIECIYLKDGELVSEEIQESNAINGKEDIKCVAVDISGDGVSELLSLNKDDYKMYRISDEDGLKLETYCEGTELTNKMHLFPNDYNGDGKIDMLYYDPARLWNMVLSTGDAFSDPISCMKNNLFQRVRLNDADKYRYSLKEMQKPTIAIRTADFDGDGTADVGVFNNFAGNYYLEVGFSPYCDSRSSCSFMYSKRYNMPINYTHQTIQLGRFLPQENISILSGLPRNPSNYAKSHIVSLCPNSAYYSVEQIVDGLGNATELSYDYLIYNGKDKDAFYTCDGRRVSYNIDKKSVPMLALKEVKTYGVNGKAIIKKYNYRNALLHRGGHGFMGFETVVVRSYVGDNLVDRLLREYNLELMGSHCIPLLFTEKLFHGENQLIKEHYFEYRKYICSRNDKVILPLPLQDRESVFDVDRKYVVLKNIITVNTYESDLNSETAYDKIVQLNRTVKGFDNVKSLSPKDGQYYEEMSIDYKNDISKWIVNRPKQVMKYVCDKVNDRVGEVQLFEYDEVNPLKVVKETKMPNVNADANDSLTIVIKYKYDIVGNVVERTLSSPSLKADKIVKTEYGEIYQYRYKTKSVDELGREVICKYDADFGILTATIDYNDHITRVEKEPFGIKDVVIMPDGMRTVKVLQWSGNNKYAPRNSSYYYWEKSVGNAEKMVFYHKSGVELRTVTFDINGKAVIVDKTYDDYGNLKQESYPYYENEDKLFVLNIYDTYNRIVEKLYPNGLAVNYVYDGNSVQAESSSVDGLKKYKKETCNVMGWITSVIDNAGEEIKYEYYSDGSLKSAQVGGNKNSQVLFSYDNRRNKVSVRDPNYGTMSYKYDALGNIKKMVSAQYAIEMEYDVLGRLNSRVEKDFRSGKTRVARWEYSRDNGYDGLLTRVSTSGGHQMEYVYDDKFRIMYTIEYIKGGRYKTAYSYDEASRVSAISYPSGFCVEKKYSNTGYEMMVCDAKTQTVLWKTDKTNSAGYITEYQVGNGLKTQYSYNPYDFMVEKIVTKRGDEVLQSLDYRYDGMCNMISRSDHVDYNCEVFEYDSYERLTKIILNSEVNGLMTYFDNGNIQSKEMNGEKVLYNATYAVNKPNAIISAKSDNEKMFERFNQNIVYSSFDNVIAIEDENSSLLMDYGYDNERVFMQCISGDKIKKKVYAGDCEYIEEDGVTKILTYLDGPMGVFAVCVKNEGNDTSETINYIHKDNLTSWNIITDEDGRLLEKLSFDAWGNIRDPQKWEEDFKGESTMFDRGFTGHEHLWDFGLIHMNGRLYDPLMSMMLSPDNNIQMPKSSQNFNRYSYCLNNPLKYNDPTGEWVESIVLGIAGGAANLVFNAPKIDSFGEAALLFGVGFIKGFLTEYTMGQSWFLQVGVAAVTEGIVAGGNCMVSVGDGDFKFSGDDWNSIKTASHYGLGSGLVKGVMYTYMTEPTEDQYGVSIFESSYHKEFAHGLTSLAAHGMGCWFSHQPFLPTMGFKDVGFDLEMLGIIAKRLLASYVAGTDFGEKALEKRAQDIKNSILEELLEEMPDHPDFGYEYDLLGVFFEDGRLYVVGNIFQMIPGEMIEVYPKPYMEEVITFPFSYSLFKTLFFNK